MKRKEDDTDISYGREIKHSSSLFMKRTLKLHQHERKQADTMLVVMFLVAILIVAGCLMVYAIV